MQFATDGVRALLNGEARDLCDVELDMARLTPFQRDVYALVRAIPPGQTRTYGELARDLGDVGLSRAVGQALGHNPFAPIVPCHRVIGADGSLTGYGGGLPLKRKLLEHEARVSGTKLDLFG